MTWSSSLGERMMSDKPKIPLALAKEIAEEWMDAIRPHCDMVCVGGPLRREEPEINWIEIMHGFEYGDPRNNDRLIALLQKAKQENIIFHKISFRFPAIDLVVDGVEVAIRFWPAKPRVWGFETACHSGSSDFFDYLHSCIMRRFGLSHYSDIYWNLRTSIPDEATCFRLCGLPEDVPMSVRVAWTEYSTPETFGLKRQR
jgi:hypothetical protein